MAVVAEGKFANSGEMGFRKQFDGTDDYLSKTVANFRSADSQGAITGWVKTGSTTRTLFSSCDINSGTRYFSLNISSGGYLEIAQRNNDTEDKVVGSTLINNMKLHHVAAIAIDTPTPSWLLYVNGVLQELTVTNSNSGDWFLETTAKDNVNIGALIYTIGAKYWNDIISNVKVWSTPLTQAQVLEDMQKNSVTGVNPVAHWPLDEPSGASARDIGVDASGPYTLTQATAASQPRAVRDMVPQRYAESIFSETWLEETVQQAGWVISSGADFRIEWDSTLKARAVVCVTAGSIAFPLPMALQDMTKQNILFRANLYKSADANELTFFPVANLPKAPSAGNGFNGYGNQISTTERFNLSIRYTNGAAVAGQSNYTATGAASLATWYLIDTYRTYAGAWTCYKDHAAASVTLESGSWPRSDATYTSNLYIVVEMDAGDRCGGISVSRYATMPMP